MTVAAAGSGRALLELCKRRLSKRTILAFRPGNYLVGWAALLWFSPLALPVHAGDTPPQDVSAYVTVTEVKEKSVKIRHAKRNRFKVTSEITIKNTSDKTILPPIRSVVNIIGAGCSDKIWTRTFSKVQTCEISQVRKMEALAPGESVSFPVEFEKPLSVEISYEILTYGILEAGDHARN